MAIHGCERIHVSRVWDDEFKNLNYITEAFNDTASTEFWLQAGYANKFVGDMCDMRSPQPTWNSYFVGYFSQLGWKNIGTSYYRMIS